VFETDLADSFTRREALSTCPRDFHSREGGGGA
jgi:hypothetical protein